MIRFDNRDIGPSTRSTAAGVPDVVAAFTAMMQGQPISTPYLLRDMADDVVGLLDALGALRTARANVAGAAMGGAIAQTFAIHHPARLSSLTSIIATTGAPDLPLPTPTALATLFKPPPRDLAEYVDRYVETWQVLRGPGVQLDGARDRD